MKFCIQAHAVSLLTTSTGLQGVAAHNMPSSLARHTPCDISILAADAAHGGAEGWLSYGIYADGRLAPAGGPSERRPNILVRILHDLHASHKCPSTPGSMRTSCRRAARGRSTASPALRLTLRSSVMSARLICSVGWAL